MNCPYCGGWLLKDDRKCHGCGAPRQHRDHEADMYVAPDYYHIGWRLATDSGALFTAPGTWGGEASSGPEEEVE